MLLLTSWEWCYYLRAQFCMQIPRVHLYHSTRAAFELQTLVTINGSIEQQLTRHVAGLFRDSIMMFGVSISCPYLYKSITPSDKPRLSMYKQHKSINTTLQYLLPYFILFWCNSLNKLASFNRKIKISRIDKYFFLYCIMFSLPRANFWKIHIDIPLK